MVHQDANFFLLLIFFWLADVFNFNFKWGYHVTCTYHLLFFVHDLSTPYSLTQRTSALSTSMESLALIRDFTFGNGCGLHGPLSCHVAQPGHVAFLKPTWEE